MRLTHSLSTPPRCPWLALAYSCASISLAQTAKPASAYPTHLPYAFSNFVWWTDADLRAQLKKQIPGLGDEIAPDRPAESRIRETLKTLLKQKGVTADVITEDPSPWSLTAETAPGGSAPAIIFSILNPQSPCRPAYCLGCPQTQSPVISNNRSTDA